MLVKRLNHTEIKFFSLKKKNPPKKCVPKMYCPPDFLGVGLNLALKNNYTLLTHIQMSVDFLTFPNYVLLGWPIIFNKSDMKNVPIS